jgi:hypothetical protein
VAGLYPTGVGNDGALIAAGTVDPHWKVVASTDPVYLGPSLYRFDAATEAAYPVSGPWAAPVAGSAWLGLNPNDTNTGSSTFSVEATFDLTGYDPATAALDINVSCDNDCAISINGVQKVAGALGFDAIHPAHLLGDFKAGKNVIQVAFTNTGGPAGYYVGAIAAAGACLPNVVGADGF